MKYMHKQYKLMSAGSTTLCCYASVANMAHKLMEERSHEGPDKAWGRPVVSLEY
jgi:hypothetical protein